MERAVCFAGHKDSWKNVGMADKVLAVVTSLIEEGYLTFYVGRKGEFDKIVVAVLRGLKRENEKIKIIKVTSYSEALKEGLEYFDECATPAVEEIHFKRQIIERNKWMVDQSDVLVCNVQRKRESGAYRTFRYAQKKGIRIINLSGEVV